MTTRFYLDTEFSDHGGWLLSISLLRADGASLYLVRPSVEIEAEDAVRPMNEWVIANVMPILYDIPDGHEAIDDIPIGEWGNMISAFLYPEGNETGQVQIIADWMTDHGYLLDLLITGPGDSVPMGKQTDFTVIRHVDIYPTDLPDAVQHNALWDTLAIRRYVELAI